MNSQLKIYRLPDLIENIRLKRSTIYKAIKDGTFPAPISLGARAVGWRVEDVDAWLESRVSTHVVKAEKR